MTQIWGRNRGQRSKSGQIRVFTPKMVQKGQFWGENWVLTRILSQKSNWQTQNPENHGFWGLTFRLWRGFDKDFGKLGKSDRFGENPGLI